MTQLQRLAKPVPRKFVSTLPATKKRPSLGYVSHAVVTEVLLMVVGPFDWRVEPVHGKDGAIIGCLGHLNVSVDDRYVEIVEVGEAELNADDDGNYDEGGVLKNSASDALKRCAMRLGLALDLWADKHGGYFLYDELVKRATRSEGTADLGASPQPAAVPAEVDSDGVSRGPTRLLPPDVDATGLCIECGRAPEDHAPRCSRRPF